MMNASVAYCHTAANASATPATQTPSRKRCRGIRGGTRVTYILYYTYNERTNRLGQLTIIAM